MSNSVTKVYISSSVGKVYIATLVVGFTHLVLLVRPICVVQ